MTGFVGIADGKDVKRGERLTDSHLVKVEIPEREAQSLKNFAYSDDARSSLIGQRVCRDLSSGSLVLRQDTKTPVTELSFGQNLPDGVEERAVGVPIDPRKMVSSLLQPGDEVSFIVPSGPLNRSTRAVGLGRPTPAKPAVDKATPKPDAAKPDAAKPDAVKPDAVKPDAVKPEAMAEGSGEADTVSGNLDVIGPFTVLSVGNRLNRVELWQANQMPQGQENVLMVLVRVKKEQDRSISCLRPIG